MASTFLIELDTVLQQEYPIYSNAQKREEIRRAESERVATVVKAAALMCKQVILSDTQVIDNKGFHYLYAHDEAFQKFLVSRIGDDPSVIVGILNLRRTESLSEVLMQMFDRGMEFSSLWPELNSQVSEGKISYDEFRSQIHGCDLIETIEALVLQRLVMG